MILKVATCCESCAKTSRRILRLLGHESQHRSFADCGKDRVVEHPTESPSACMRRIILFYAEQMGAEGLGRKLLLNPPPAPQKTLEKQTVGTVTASHKCSSCKHFRVLSMPALQREAGSAEERLLCDLRQSVPQSGRVQLHMKNLCCPCLGDRDRGGGAKSPKIRRGVQNFEISGVPEFDPFLQRFHSKPTIWGSKVQAFQGRLSERVPPPPL